jgi:hypothetical protein
MHHFLIDLHLYLFFLHSTLSLNLNTKPSKCSSSIEEKLVHLLLQIIEKLHIKHIHRQISQLSAMTNLKYFTQLTWV